MVRIDATGKFAYSIKGVALKDTRVVWQSPPNGIGLLGENWYNVSTGLTAEKSSYPVIAISPQNPFHLVFGGGSMTNPNAGPGVWEGKPSTEKPKEPVWRWASEGAFFHLGTYVTAIAFAPGNDDIVYAGFNNGEIFATYDIKAAKPKWTLIADLGGAITRIMPVRGTSSNLLYVSVFQLRTPGTQVAIIYDTGDRQNKLDITNTGLPDLPIRAVVQDSVGNLYLATEVGVYTETGRRNFSPWARFGTGLPNVQVTDLQYYAPANELVAATYGRGVWVLKLPPAPKKQAAIERSSATFTLAPFEKRDRKRELITMRILYATEKTRRIYCHIEHTINDYSGLFPLFLKWC